MDDLNESTGSDDGPSNATLIFAEEVNREFKKAFPLKSEIEAAMLKTVRPDGSRRRKLDFELLASPKPSSELVSVKTLKLKLEAAEQRANQLATENCGLLREKEEINVKLQNLSAENSKLRARVIKIEGDAKEKELLQETKTQMIESQLEDFRTVTRKYYMWFQTAQSQLIGLQEKLKTSSKITPADAYEINTIAFNAMNECLDVTFSNDIMDNLVAGSLREFSGVEFTVPKEEDQEESRIFANISTGQLEASVVEGARAYEEPSFVSAINNDANSTMMNVSLNDTLANTSINYEKDEKIQRLLLENSVLKDRMNVSMGRAQQSMLLEEKNRSLEMKNDFLQKKLDRTFGEIESMRMGIAKKIFTDDPMQSTDKSLKMVDRLRDLLTDNQRLEKNIESATSKITKLTMNEKMAEQRFSNLEDAYSKALEQKQKVEDELNEAKMKVEELTAETSRLQKELEEHKNKRPTSPTDAGDTTQILHMPINPLTMAFEESRKRKNNDNDDTLTAKRSKDDEEVRILEEKLKKSEREKETALNLQTDLLKKFREVSTALTGFQIKLKDVDEGICAVNSVYDSRGDQFVFKYHWNTGGMDLLDVGGSDSEMIQQWESEMRRYIGERQSVPSFLAAVTIRNEQERAEEQMAMLECTHTFSVLHE